MGNGEGEGHFDVADGPDEPDKLHRSCVRAGEPVEKDLMVFLETGYYDRLGIAAEVLAWLLGCVGT